VLDLLPGFTETVTACEGGARPGRRRGERQQWRGAGPRRRLQAGAAPTWGGAELGRHQGSAVCWSGQGSEARAVAPRMSARRQEMPRKAREPTVGGALWLDGQPMRVLAGNDYFLHNGPISLLSGNGLLQIGLQIDCWRRSYAVIVLRIAHRHGSMHIFSNGCP
jgi:hypothetical protein